MCMFVNCKAHDFNTRENLSGECSECWRQYREHQIEEARLRRWLKAIGEI
jgi:hypothetical protein